MFFLNDHVQQKLANDIYLTVEKLNGMAMMAVRAGLTIDVEVQSGGEIHSARGRTVQIPVWSVVINRPFELTRNKDEVTDETIERSGDSDATQQKFDINQRGQDS